jgi:hypothetical protein
MNCYHEQHWLSLHFSVKSEAGARMRAIEFHCGQTPMR